MIGAIIPSPLKGSQVVCRHLLGMNLTGTAQQRTKHTIRQRHKHAKRHQPQHLARAPSPDSLPKTNDLAHIRPHFSPYSPSLLYLLYCLLCIDTNTLHYSPPYSTYIYCLLCIDTNTLHHTYISPHALPILDCCTLGWNVQM